MPRNLLPKGFMVFINRFGNLRHSKPSRSGSSTCFLSWLPGVSQSEGKNSADDRNSHAQTHDRLCFRTAPRVFYRGCQVELRFLYVRCAMITRQGCFRNQCDTAIYPACFWWTRTPRVRSKGECKDVRPYITLWGSFQQTGCIILCGLTSLLGTRVHSLLNLRC